MVVLGDDIDGLNPVDGQVLEFPGVETADSRKLVFGVLREHCNDDVVDDLNFCPVRGCYINEDIPSVDTDLGVI